MSCGLCGVSEEHYCFRSLTSFESPFCCSCYTTLWHGLQHYGCTVKACAAEYLKWVFYVGRNCAALLVSSLHWWPVVRSAAHEWHSIKPWTQKVCGRLSGRSPLWSQVSRWPRRLIFHHCADNWAVEVWRSSSNNPINPFSENCYKVVFSILSCVSITKVRKALEFLSPLTCFLV